MFQGRHITLARAKLTSLIGLIIYFLCLLAGTLQGRPLVEFDKTKFTITARNEVNATITVMELQVLVPPAKLEYTYQSVIYKAGKLDFPAW